MKRIVSLFLCVALLLTLATLLFSCYRADETDCNRDDFLIGNANKVTLSAYDDEDYLAGDLNDANDYGDSEDADNVLLSNQDGGVAPLAGSETGGKDPVIGEICNVDLSGYTIIVGKELTDFGLDDAQNLAKSIKGLTGVTMSVTKDVSTETVKNDSLEILIGKTSREESIATYNEIVGAGWAVCVFEHKIVIVGATPFLTTIALRWFEQTYLNVEHISGDTLTVNSKNLVSDLPTLPLTQTIGVTKLTFPVVYEKGKDDLDAPYQVAVRVRDSLSQKTGLTVPLATVGATVAREILVGNMSRSDVKAEIAKIEPDEYAVTIKNGKIYLVAWSDDVLPAACDLFEEVLLASSLVDEGGNVTYLIPYSATVVRKCEGSQWITDFPKPKATGLYPEAAIDVYDGALQYIYTGNGATREAFVAYCKTLKAAGFTPLGNGDIRWEGSSFCTFLHKEKGISLHVSHMAFTHAAEQAVEGLVNSIRIVSGPIESGGRILDVDYFRPQIAGTEVQVASGTADYVKRMNSQITSNWMDFSAADNWGFGQIITLADGSFILIDGGRCKGKNEAKNVWQILNTMHKRAHNADPTASNPIHIRAWIITHEHGDHHNLMRNFINTYGSYPELRFDYLLGNFGSGTQLRAPSAAPTVSLRDNMKTYQDTVANGFEFVQVNTGQVFYFANCRLEILTTVDDMYPWRCSEQNNASLILRTTLYETDGVNSHETTSLWLGDAEVQASSVARAMYGSFLQSDHVQVSHHGNKGGSEKQLYELVGACEVIWFPSVVKQSALDNCLNDAWSYSPAFKNPKCKLLIFNGSNISGIPVYNVTLTITATGAAYDRLYDAITGDSIKAENKLWAVIDVPAYRAAVGK